MFQIISFSEYFKLPSDGAARLIHQHAIQELGAEGLPNKGTTLKLSKFTIPESVYTLRNCVLVSTQAFSHVFLFFKVSYFLKFPIFQVPKAFRVLITQDEVVPLDWTPSQQPRWAEEACGTRRIICFFENLLFCKLIIIDQKASNFRLPWDLEFHTPPCTSTPTQRSSISLHAPRICPFYISRRIWALYEVKNAKTR